MFNSNDIYDHLIHGGSIEELHKALSNEIQDAQNRINREKTAAEQEAKARTAAFKSLKHYFALVNPHIDDDIINAVLDTLETVEIKVSKNKDGLYDITAVAPLHGSFI